MHDHAPCGSATLSGCAHGAEKDGLCSHFEVCAWRNDERIISAEFHDCSTEAAMNGLRDIQTHVDRAGSRYQWDPRIIRQFLADRFTIAHQQCENRWVSAGFATDALGNFCDGDGRQWRFF